VTENNPAPDRYDTTTAFRKSTAKSIPVSLKSRVGGTQISINQSIGNSHLPSNDTKYFFIFI
jgi:hypothetical protein